MEIESLLYLWFGRASNLKMINSAKAQLCNSEARFWETTRSRSSARPVISLLSAIIHHLRFGTKLERKCYKVILMYHRSSENINVKLLRMEIESLLYLWFGRASKLKLINSAKAQLCNSEARFWETTRSRSSARPVISLLSAIIHHLRFGTKLERKCYKVILMYHRSSENINVKLLKNGNRIASLSLIR